MYFHTTFSPFIKHSLTIYLWHTFNSAEQKLDVDKKTKSQKAQHHQYRVAWVAYIDLFVSCQIENLIMRSWTLSENNQYHPTHCQRQVSMATSVFYSNDMLRLTINEVSFLNALCSEQFTSYVRLLLGHTSFFFGTLQMLNLGFPSSAFNI